MSQQFKSQAEEIRFYVKQVLKDGKEHTVKDFKDFITKETGEEGRFTDGCYAGALRDLLKENGYHKKDRGCYYYEEPLTTPLDKKVNEILTTTINELTIAAKDINIFDATPNDIKTVNKIKELISMLNNHVN